MPRNLWNASQRELGEKSRLESLWDGLETKSNAPRIGAWVSLGWGALLGAGIVGGGLLSPGHGFYCPPLYFGFGLLLLLGAFSTGRRWGGPGSGRSRILQSGFVLGLLFFSPLAFRGLDDLYLSTVSRSDGEVRFSLPGIDLEARTVADPDRSRQEVFHRLSAQTSFLATDTIPVASGRYLLTVWRRKSGAPPYELLIVISGAVFAWWGHRRGRRRGEELLSRVCG